MIFLGAGDDDGFGKFYCPTAAYPLSGCLSLSLSLSYSLTTSSRCTATCGINYAAIMSCFVAKSFGFFLWKCQNKLHYFLSHVSLVPVELIAWQYTLWNTLRAQACARAVWVRCFWISIECRRQRHLAPSQSPCDVWLRIDINKFVHTLSLPPPRLYS